MKYFTSVDVEFNPAIKAHINTIIPIFNMSIDMMFINPNKVKRPLTPSRYNNIYILEKIAIQEFPIITYEPREEFKKFFPCAMVIALDYTKLNEEVYLGLSRMIAKALLEPLQWKEDDFDIKILHLLGDYIEQTILEAVEEFNI